MHLYPTHLTIAGKEHLLIQWSDGTRRRYAFRELRDNCPCATCRERRKKDHLPAPLFPILRPEETRPLAITAMEPVGSYAYKIVFSDGHDTGIFSLELLQELGVPD